MEILVLLASFAKRVWRFEILSPSLHEESEFMVGIKFTFLPGTVDKHGMTGYISSECHSV